ncbi:MAG: hypothetical protein LBH00_06260 [Planctomycetaceae bacterium]|jgi:type IV secretory pathway VirB10-like protein|nr:hypothetical protein [Planctomycetaceae bacterium]
MFPKQQTVFFLLLGIGLLAGCQTSGSRPVNPFAVSQNRNTVPPPATFSSQEFYLGQTPGGDTVPAVPAATFQPSSPAAPAALPGTTVPPPAAPSSPLGSSVEQKAELFTAEKKETPKEPQWVAVNVPATSQTAFQTLEAKSRSDSYDENGVQKTAVGNSPSLVVGTSHAITTITDETPAPALAEPKSVYSGEYTQ